MNGRKIAFYLLRHVRLSSGLALALGEQLALQRSFSAA